MSKSIFGRIDKLMTVTKNDVSESVSRYKVVVETDGPFISSFLIANGEPVDNAYGEAQVMGMKQFVDHIKETIMMDVEWPEGDTSKVAYLSGIELPEDLRSRGIGKKMMMKIEGKAKRKAASHMVLAAEGHAVGFYEKLGYSEFDTNVFLTLMRKKL